MLFQQEPPESPPAGDITTSALSFSAPSSAAPSAAIRGKGSGPQMRRRPSVLARTIQSAALVALIAAALLPAGTSAASATGTDAAPVRPAPATNWPFAWLNNLIA